MHLATPRKPYGESINRSVTVNKLLVVSASPSCDGFVRVSSSNHFGKSLGYHSRLFTTNSFEEETVKFKLSLLYIAKVSSSYRRGEGERESQKSGEIATDQVSLKFIE
ncbi:hypothetical protein TNCV_904201 [Trichonephila clavipes]|nr:hypothetical protein TNCV_904201 [Trichonephila clavipes]